MKKTFPEVLKTLRGSKNMKEFADFIGVPVKTYEHYEYGTRKPPVAFLLQLVERCQVSADWVLGLSEKQNTSRTNGNVSINGHKNAVVNGHAINSSVSIAENKSLFEAQIENLKTKQNEMKNDLSSLNQSIKAEHVSLSKRLNKIESIRETFSQSVFKAVQKMFLEGNLEGALNEMHSLLVSEKSCPFHEKLESIFSEKKDFMNMSDYVRKVSDEKLEEIKEILFAFAIIEISDALGGS